jgi:hypothetical protein
LPYEIGLELGFVWSEQTIPLDLAGNLAQHEALALFVQAAVGHLEPVKFVVAWTRVIGIILSLE